MSKSIIITRPNYEKVTSYLFSWSEVIVKLAQSKLYAVHDLQRAKSSRKLFESYVNGHKPVFIFMNGHGNSDEITGQDDQVIVDASSHINNSIIYARSCDAGQKLGMVLVKNGATAFIGYSRKFVFGYLPEKMAHPLDDTLASFFLDSSNLIPSTIIKGHSTGEANRRSKFRMYANFRRMISSVATFEERYASRWLWSNINCQVLIGDDNAKI
jgi:hypothetical protein